jgi:hypothetical protein
MRGSPLIRTLIVLIALLAAGFGLSVLGNKRPSPKPVVTPENVAHSESINTPFVLTLSAPAKKLTIESLGETHNFDASSQTISGILPLEEGHPTLFIDIEWADANPSPRFAKLVLEPIGHPTQTKIFDTVGPLSDVWELHLHHDEHE